MSLTLVVVFDWQGFFFLGSFGLGRFLVITKLTQNLLRSQIVCVLMITALKRTLSKTDRSPKRSK